MENMEVGARYTIKWTDGEIASGKYIEKHRGYFCFRDDSGNVFVCHESLVSVDVEKQSNTEEK